jgi:hypothetical protein
MYIHSQLSEQFSESQGGFGATFNGTGGYQKAGTSSLKRVTGRSFTTNCDFIEGSRNFRFLSQKDKWKLWKPKALIQKVLFRILGPLKTFSSWHYPFTSLLSIVTLHFDINFKIMVPTLCSPPTPNKENYISQKQERVLGRGGVGGSKAWSALSWKRHKVLPPDLQFRMKCI